MVEGKEAAAEAGEAAVEAEASGGDPDSTPHQCACHRDDGWGERSAPYPARAQHHLS